MNKPLPNCSNEVLDYRMKTKHIDYMVFHLIALVAKGPLLGNRSSSQTLTMTHLFRIGQIFYQFRKTICVTNVLFEYSAIVRMLRFKPNDGY